MKQWAFALCSAGLVLLAAGCGGGHHDAGSTAGGLGAGTRPSTNTVAPTPVTSPETVGGVTVPLPAGWVAQPPPAGDGSGDHTDYLFGTSADPNAQLMVTADLCTACAGHGPASLVPTGATHPTKRNAREVGFRANVAADALSTYWRGGTALPTGYQTTGIVVVGSAGGTPAYAVVAVTLPASQHALATQVLDGVTIPGAGTPTTSSTATAAACPTPAQLLAAYQAAPGMYPAPPGTVTGFAGVTCWSGYAVATTVVADPTQDQVEPVAFATTGGLHTITQSEYPAFTAAVCRGGSGAPGGWVGPGGVVNCPG